MLRELSCVNTYCDSHYHMRSTDDHYVIGSEPEVLYIKKKNLTPDGKNCFRWLSQNYHNMIKCNNPKYKKSGIFFYLRHRSLG